MQIEQFIKLRPFLYHLTDRRNLDNIFQTKMIYSTIDLVKKSNLSEVEQKVLLMNKRKSHSAIPLGDRIIYIRDQNPILENNLKKTLTKGWKVSDFYMLLNSRVFFWPTIDRLNRHYKRYLNEHPIILRVKTSEIIELNINPEFSRLNTGATRSNAKWNGGPPARGENTFYRMDKYPHANGSIAEVTFVDFCKLPKDVYFSNSPLGPWNLVEN
jgi:hypothetical protein